MIVGGSKCVLANSECRGRLEWHHAVKQQRLKREFKYGAVWKIRDAKWIPCSHYDPVVYSQEGFARSLYDILGDPRNRIWLCSAHHEKLTNARVQVPIPESVWEFCDEFGLRAMLENDLARAA